VNCLNSRGGIDSSENTSETNSFPSLVSAYSLMFSSYEVVSKSFRTGRSERELQMVQLSATRCSCIAILLGTVVSFAAISSVLLLNEFSLLLLLLLLLFVVVVYFVIDSVRENLDTPSYANYPTKSTLVFFITKSYFFRRLLDT
jgi:hypothetical protein